MVIADEFTRDNGLLPSEFLKQTGVDFINAEEFSLSEHKPHLIFIADVFSITRNRWILRSDARICYIPYGTSISAAAYSYRHQYNLPLHNKAWRVFVAGDFVVKLYREHCDSGSSHVVAMGHPKFEAIYSSPRQHRSPTNEFSRKEPCEVLWNIHSERDGQWSTWNDYGLYVLRLFASLDDVKLVCRPHPFFFDSFKEKKEMEYTRNLIINNKNTVIDQRPSIKESFASCDALLTDGSSIIYDFFFTSKPILYLRSSDSAYMHSHCFDLINKYHYIGDGKDKIKTFVKKVVCKDDPLTKRRMDGLLRDSGLPDSLGTGKNIGRYIKNEMNNETEH